MGDDVAGKPNAYQFSMEPVSDEKPNLMATAEILRGSFVNFGFFSFVEGQYQIDLVFRPISETEALVLQCRAMMTPLSAKRIVLALAGSLQRYEERYGEIKEVGPMKKTEVPRGD